MPCSWTPPRRPARRRMPMPPLTLEQNPTQLQLLSAPETLAAWEARHPTERERVRAVLEALVDRELARRTDHTVAARIAAAKFLRVQTVDSFNFEDQRGHPEAPVPVPEPPRHGSRGRGGRGALRGRLGVGEDASRPRRGLRPVPAGPPGAVH